MEMAIELGDLRMLQMLYKLTSRRNYAGVHPRLRFRHPMRHAAAHGRLEMLEWLKGRKERDDWLEDPWLLSSALESYDLAIVQWVHEAYEGDESLVVRWKRLDEDAERGKLELLQWVLTTYPEVQLTTDAMDGAAANGHLKTVEFLHAQGAECTTAAMDKAAANGHWRVVEFLHKNRQEGCTVRAMDEAAIHGHLDIVKFLRAARKEGCTSKAMDGAAEGGHVDVVRFLLEHYPDSCSGSALDAALRGGHIPVLKFLHDQYGKVDECGMSMGYAISCGHVAAVTFVCTRYKANLRGDSLTSANVDTLFDLVRLFDACGIDGWTTKVMDHAAGIGCLDAVRYLHERRSEGCTTKAMDRAAANGHLDVVKFLHEHRTEGSSKDAMDGAAENGALDVMHSFKSIGMKVAPVLRSRKRL